MTEEEFNEKFEKFWSNIMILVPKIARGTVMAKKDSVKVELKKEFGNV